jgi:hypothetical protein
MYEAEQRLKRQKEVSIRAVARRGQITPGVASRPLDRAFLRRLRDVDPRLEIVWHRAQQKWVLYRRARDNVASSDEVLVLVTSFRQPPGDWLIHKLHSMDPSRRFPEAGDDPVRMAELQNQELNKYEYERERSKERDHQTTIEHLASDVKPCFQQRESSHEIKQVVKAKPGRKIIYGPDSQPLRHK